MQLAHTSTNPAPLVRPRATAAVSSLPAGRKLEGRLGRLQERRPSCVVSAAMSKCVPITSAHHTREPSSGGLPSLCTQRQ